MSCVACSDSREPGSLAAVGDQEPPFRIEKVLDVKRQLAEGRYEIAERLDVILDRLLEELLQVEGFNRDLLRRIKTFLLLEGIGGKDCTC